MEISIDFKSVEEKWRKIWEEKKVFEANPDPSKEKVFVTSPYPYMSGLLHLGHGLTESRIDFYARYKRLKGYNVLFPMGFHITGSPIVSKSMQLKEGNQKIINDLKQDGIPEEDFDRLKTSEGWALYFIRYAEETMKKMGFSIDWRREFYTSRINPWYNKFIEWQYRKLQEKGYVIKGKHIITYDPVINNPVGDHDRSDEYAGIDPVQGYIIKFKYEDYYIPVFTLRPETLPGVTNLWINTEVKYGLFKVDGELWILPDNIVVEEIKGQDHEIEKIKDIDVRELVGKEAINLYNNEKVVILPAEFVDPEIGTGIVMSVPSHAPYDYVALMDLIETEYMDLAKRAVNSMKILFHNEKFKDIPAKEVVKKMNIKDQKDKELLEKATQELYSEEFYNSTLTEIYGEHAGKKIYEIKEEIGKNIVEKKIGLVHYIMPIRFKSRYGNKCIAKMIDNQWFLKYSDEEWKKLAHECIDNMKFYPENAREDFHSKIDWLKDWACTHKNILGTSLPWDKDWIIESLSDSTIYMAYYTIAHLIKNIDPNKIEDDLFDYIFLDKGSEGDLISKYGDIVKDMKKEFNYWYPLDLRNSGKDLIPNHLSFFIFHHVAIFDKKYWPKGISINGFTVDAEGRKMSKSLGNYISLKQAIEKYPVDVIRFLLASSNNSNYDDVKIDLSKAEYIKKYIYDLFSLSINNYNKYGEDRDNNNIDNWFENRINKIMNLISIEYERLNYMNVVNYIYLLDNSYDWYIKRTLNNPNKRLVNKFIEYKLISLYPIVPYIVSEIFEKIGIDPYNIKYPETKYVEDYEKEEEFLRSLLDDITKIKVLLNNNKIKGIKIIMPKREKYMIFEELKNNKSNIDSYINKYPQYKNMIIYVKNNAEILNKYLDYDKELNIIESSIYFIKSYINVGEIYIEKEEESNDKKRERAMPSKPAIIFF
ncbi:leucine--tRNA ligase [Nanobdella aerobiophila]|uniref:Leucine--tRNA ligase n=1 Tax=Nanobdella aerobiophila TaxID=2586965 RepID=A0A915T052_9ARCH|nr:leucine--tRNA ligase [Nanobdella aerobiophila]BBL45709.1 leucine--tRNA ligase [Nanobdella aerobiophila]